MMRLPRWLTPHRAILLGLLTLTACAFVVSAVDDDFVARPHELAASLVVALAASYTISVAGGALVRVPPGSDSWAITALILFFVLPSGADRASLATVAIGAGAAAASKYLLAWRRRLIVNPAVVGAVVCYALAYGGVTVAGTSVSYPSWWIAAEPLLWPMVVVGVLMVTAIGRWPLVLVFLATSLATLAVVGAFDGGTLSTWLVSTPMFFVAAVMLPEPLTSPTTRVPRAVYGAGVAVLMYCQQPIEISDAFTLEFVPEVALAIGCLFTFGVRLAGGGAPRARLDVTSCTPLAQDSWRLVARGDSPHFRPGQWASLSAPSWTVPLWGRSRRVFSFVNPPHCDDVEFAFTASAPPSRFKSDVIDGRTRRLYLDIEGGDFVVPRRGSAPLVLIAGGVGITPVISMLRGCEPATIARCTVVHVVRGPERAAFDDDLTAARAAGARIVVRHSATLSRGFDPTTLGDALDMPGGAHYYVSGSPVFVRRTTAAIRRLDPRSGWNPLRLHRDSFAGY